MPVFNAVPTLGEAVDTTNDTVLIWNASGSAVAQTAVTNVGGASDMGDLTGAGFTTNDTIRWSGTAFVPASGLTVTAGGLVIAGNQAGPTTATTFVGGAADRLQLVVRGHSTQTNAIFQVTDSADAAVLTAFASGHQVHINQATAQAATLFVGGGNVTHVTLKVSGLISQTADIVAVIRPNGNQTYSISATGQHAIAEAAGDTVGFFNTTPAGQQNITGSRGGNAALANLLTGLATLGLITDGTSA